MIRSTSMLSQRVSRAAIGLGLCATMAACASAPMGKFVWLDDLPQTEIGAPGSAYVIGPYDVISFTAFNHPEVSGRGAVRTDGNLTVPLLGDVVAAGKSPADLGREIERQLNDRKLVVGSRVTVVVDQVAPIRVSIIGEVKSPGLYTLEAGSGLAEALATSGGFSEFAHRDRLFIIRRVPELVRIRFKYSDLTSATGNALTFRLKAGDTMLVQ
jgi:polysaccharide biosynthesis/export protein